MREVSYQSSLMKKIKSMFPGCLILKNDPRHLQGLPDLIVLYKNMWAALEVKISGSSEHQPNQQHYVKTLNDMSFASFIHPDNEREVLSELQRSFGVTRKTRIPES